MFFEKKKSVYTGYDMQEFNHIRDALDAEKIVYDYKVRNHQNQFIAPGIGTVRGRFGSLGTDLTASDEYEIRVSPEHEGKAVQMIQNIIRESGK